jgi:undecaprenyl-diphosphatase
LENLKQLDRDLLIFLNNLGSEPFDGFWLFVTKQFHWTPLFLLLFYLLYRKTSLKFIGIMILFLAGLILFTDQLTNVFKYSFERLRPCNVPDLQDQIRIVLQRSSYSFFSGHASNSMATTVFFFLLFQRYYTGAVGLFIFPLVFAYSRIYLGLHYPGDILAGYAFGAGAGLFFHHFFLKAERRYLTTPESR